MNKSLFLKTIRLFVAFLLILGGGRTLNAQNASEGITLDMTGVTLEKVMDAIEQQSKYLFLNDRVDVTRTVSIKVENAAIETVLDKLFSGWFRSAFRVTLFFMPLRVAFGSVGNVDVSVWSRP